MYTYYARTEPIVQLYSISCFKLSLHTFKIIHNSGSLNYLAKQQK